MIRFATSIALLFALPTAAQEAPRVDGQADGEGALVTINELNTDDYPDVRVIATITRNGTAVTGLAARDFRVREDEVDQRPLTVEEQLPPLSVVVTIDTSGSMADAMDATRMAATAFVAGLDPEDAAQIMLNSQSANIGGNRVETVGQNQTLQVGDNMVERIGRNRNVIIGGRAIQMLSFLTPLLQAGGRMFQRSSQRAGAPYITDVAGDFIGDVNIANELSMLTGNSGFQQSGPQRQGQGTAQASQAASLAGLTAGLITGSGLLNSFVERIHTDTVGMARTEHIGVAKNTLVGNIQSTSIGKTKKLAVSETYDYEARKSIVGRTVKHTPSATDTFRISGSGGTIIIDNSGDPIKTSHFKVKFSSVDFTSGSPDQVEALRTNKPFVQECKES